MMNFFFPSTITWNAERIRVQVRTPRSRRNLLRRLFSLRRVRRESEPATVSHPGDAALHNDRNVDRPMSTVSMPAPANPTMSRGATPSDSTFRPVPVAVALPTATGRQSPSGILYRRSTNRRTSQTSRERRTRHFWITSAMEPAMLDLQSQQGYSGTILTKDHETMYVEESIGSNILLPNFVGQSITRYTEYDCLWIFRQMCELVLVLHQNNTIHRNLHLNQFSVNPVTVSCRY